MSIVNTGASESNQKNNDESLRQLLSSFGSDLTETDYQGLTARWITCDLAAEAGLRRVDSYTAREMFGRKTGISRASSFRT